MEEFNYFIKISEISIEGLDFNNTEDDVSFYYSYFKIIILNYAMILNYVAQYY